MATVMIKISCKRNNVSRNEIDRRIRQGIRSSCIIVINWRAIQTHVRPSHSIDRP